MTMKNLAIFLTMLLVSGSCTDRSFAARYTDFPDVEYRRLIEYENRYGPDSLLEGSVRRFYFLGGEDSRELVMEEEFEYRYQRRDSGLEKREYRIGDDGEKELTTITFRSPTREEEATLSGNDTTFYERKRYDPAGRLVRETNRVCMLAPEFGIDARNFSDSEYEYDEAGRVSLTRQTLSMNGLTDRFDIVYIYDGDSDRILREEVSSPEFGHRYTTHYRSEFRGDTVVQRAFTDEVLEFVIETAEGYRSETRYGENGPESVKKKITDGEFEKEISHDFLTGTGDTVVMREGRVVMHTVLFTDMGNRVHYEYDERGNLLRELKEIGFR